MQAGSLQKMITLHYLCHSLMLISPPPCRSFKRRLPNFIANYPLPQALRDCVEAQHDVLVAQPCLGEVSSHHLEVMMV